MNRERHSSYQTIKVPPTKTKSRIGAIKTNWIIKNINKTLTFNKQQKHHQKHQNRMGKKGFHLSKAASRTKYFPPRLTLCSHAPPIRRRISFPAGSSNQGNPQSTPLTPPLPRRSTKGYRDKCEAGVSVFFLRGSVVMNSTEDLAKVWPSFSVRGLRCD